MPTVFTKEAECELGNFTMTTDLDLCCKFEPKDFWRRCCGLNPFFLTTES